MHKKDKSQYQYALLNMAILQADFGCYDEAIAAMHETIATARENKDMPCLNFSLSWLYHFRTVYGRDIDGDGERSLLGSDAENLEFLWLKSRQGEMWSILSPTLLNEAKLSLAKVWQILWYEGIKQMLIMARAGRQERRFIISTNLPT